MEQYDAHITARRLELPVPGIPPAITLQVNGVEYQHTAPATETLAQFLRNRLGLTGLKTGCGEGECGACTVLIDDQVVNSCLV
ncbi:MAG: 2Fe-2S iron-sulfur cluster binding domain-containing protein, partial [Rhodobacteraceae bacterium]|nr:2Fe-2S iron-sulfur cluster binding domain-containing protein [Paracoccaceae bacterium]